MHTDAMQRSHGHWVRREPMAVQPLHSIGVHPVLSLLICVTPSLLHPPPPPPMSESARPRANAEQRRAADPAASAFVAASAGSGKTKLLTDRLLRLMLSGVAPQRIQCLTFTKAAAAEMSVRLQRTLGRWVTLDDAPLTHALRA